MLKFKKPRSNKRIMQHLGSGGEFHLFLTSTPSMVHNVATILDINVLSENLVRSGSSLALESTDE